MRTRGQDARAIRVRIDLKPAEIFVRLAELRDVTAIQPRRFQKPFPVRTRLCERDVSSRRHDDAIHDRRRTYVRLRREQVMVALNVVGLRGGGQREDRRDCDGDEGALRPARPGRGTGHTELRKWCVDP